jgi:hypothetical protein
MHVKNAEIKLGADLKIGDIFTTEAYISLSGEIRQYFKAIKINPFYKLDTTTEYRVTVYSYKHDSITYFSGIDKTTVYVIELFPIMDDASEGPLFE